MHSSIGKFRYKVNYPTRSGSSFTAALLSAPKKAMYVFEPIWILNYENIKYIFAAVVCLNSLSKPTLNRGWDADNSTLSDDVSKLLQGLFNCDRVCKCSLNIMLQH